MKTSAIVTARMESNRLPGKVLMEVANKPMLEYLIDRLAQVESIDEIIIATSKNTSDDAIESFTKNEKVQLFRGSELNVKERVLKAAEFYNVETIVKITGDCPIIDPELIGQCIQIFKFNKVDFVTNAHIRSYPDGMDTSVFSTQTLRHSSSFASNDLEKEHVTLRIRNNPDIYKPIYLLATPELHWPELGLTLDEEGDFKLIENLINYFGPTKIFSCNQIVSYIKKNPYLLSLNGSVKRKGDT